MKKKDKPFRFTFSNFIRIAVFAAILYFSINFLSSKSNSSPQILGETTINLPPLPPLPPEIKTQIDGLASSPVIINAQSIFKDFPQKQIKEVKKQLINQIYQDLIKSIDNHE